MPASDPAALLAEAEKMAKQLFYDERRIVLALVAHVREAAEQVALHEATIDRQAEAIGELQRAEEEAHRAGVEAGASVALTDLLARMRAAGIVSLGRLDDRVRWSIDDFETDFLRALPLPAPPGGKELPND